MASLAASALQFWFVKNCLGKDIFHTAGDKIQGHLDSIDKQINPKHVSGGAKTLIHDKWAFMVGVSRYQDKNIKPMKSARNSAMLITSTFKDAEVGHFGMGHVAEVAGVQATRDNILGALFSSALTKKTLPTDLIILYFSGRTLAAPDKNDVCLCAYDTISSEPELSGISLKETLASFRRRTQCPQILCILDCSPNQVTGSKVDGLTVEELAKSTGVSVLSANVLDAESQACGSGTISCFSQFFTEALKDCQGYISVVQLVDFVQNNINAENPQTPLKAKVTFASAPASDRMGDAIIGTTLHTPWSVSKFAMGHNAQTLALERPDLVAPPVNSSAPVLDLTHLPPPTRKTVSPAPKIAKIINGETPPDEDEDATGKAVDLDAYVAYVKGQIKEKWTPPKGLKERQAVATFTVLKNGIIVDPVITKSSSDPVIDQSALAALKAASPLKALPAGAPASIQIRYVFVWRVSSK